MRTMIAAILLMATSAAIADDVDDAHKLAVTGRDAYWNCLAREYPRDSNKAMSDQDFCFHDRARVRLGATEFPGLIDRLSQPAIPERGYGNASGDRQPRHRAGAKGYRHRLRPPQGGGEIDPYSAVATFRDIDPGYRRGDDQA